MSGLHIKIIHRLLHMVVSKLYVPFLIYLQIWKFKDQLCVYLKNNPVWLWENSYIFLINKNGHTFQYPRNTI